jgi:hypothetical protein
VGFVVGKVALVQVFSEYFCFPFQFLLRLLHKIHYHVIWGWYSKSDNDRRTKWIPCLRTQP